MGAQSKIRAMMKDCTAPVLDKPVMCDGGPYPSLGHVLNLVSSNAARTKAFLNVPIKSIVALGRMDLVGSDATWRSIVNDELADGNWDDRVFGYFASEIRDLPFPARGALYNLRLHCYGGAVTVENGNHRLSAAVAWLAATQGEDAFLKKVRTTVIPLDANVVQPLLQEHQRGQQLELAQHSSNNRLYYRSTGKWVKSAFSYYSAEVAWKKEPRRFSNCFARRPPDIPECDWAQVPPTVLDAWRDVAWLQTQLNDPHLELAP